MQILQTVKDLSRQFRFWVVSVLPVQVPDDDSDSNDTRSTWRHEFCCRLSYRYSVVVILTSSHSEVRLLLKTHIKTVQLPVSQRQTADGRPWIFWTPVNSQSQEKETLLHHHCIWTYHKLSHIDNFYQQFIQVPRFGSNLFVSLTNALRLLLQHRNLQSTQQVSTLLQSFCELCDTSPFTDEESLVCEQRRHRWCRRIKLRVVSAFVNSVVVVCCVSECSGVFGLLDQEDQMLSAWDWVGKNWSGTVGRNKRKEIDETEDS